MNENLDTLRRVLGEMRLDLLERENVVATGIGYKVRGGERTGTLSIVCSVVEKVPDARLSGRALIPREVGGVPTDVVETGAFRALQARTDRWRPAPGGVSIGHKDITAGTLGCLVRDDQGTYILSNNHVLANSNAGVPGDAILQPGTYDGGSNPADKIAELARFVPISFLLPEPPSDCSVGRGAAALANLFARAVGSRTRLKAVRMQVQENLVDAALARPLNPGDLRNDILEIGTIAGLKSGELGMAIKKSGRTTGLTSDTIQQVDVTANVSYGGTSVAMFTDQLLAGPMSKGGDSGSAVVDAGNNLVGLLFAGSDTTTIINRIENVFSALQVHL
ncbi:MAG: S1 family peptidase [Methanomicrobiales archaeon]|nr:S1 family peptidase [Methanomicrobiales archaeon]